MLTALLPTEQPKIAIPLQEIKIKEFLPFVPKRTIRSFDESCSISEILQALAKVNEHEFLVSKDEFGERVLCGLCSIYDIFCFSTTVEGPLGDYEIGKVIESMNEQGVLNPSDSLDLLILRLYGRERVLVGGHDLIDNVVIVYSTDLMVYLQQSLQGCTSFSTELLKPLVKMNISDLEYKRPTIAILETQSALHGFKTLFNNGLHSLPIINASGQVVGNLDSFDISGKDILDQSRLILPVKQYLQFSAVNSITISASGTLLDAIECILVSNVGRLWVTKDANCLLGCLSISDILKLIP